MVALPWVGSLSLTQEHYSMVNPQTTPQGFTPFFKRVSQGEDRHADIYACIAILTNKTVADIQQQAESLGVPKVGPYYPYLDGDMIGLELEELKNAPELRRVVLFVLFTAFAALGARAMWVQWLPVRSLLLRQTKAFPF